ncbi:Fungal specific transcription factor domain-containing protein [Cladophialophora immunda]|nr:Fungal specific transcription factor domain-containing protein [Cladophialophora immunda]
MPAARLRTKTGCFTCKGRRLKCGEERLGQRPCCRNCHIAGRKCLWPAPEDLYDRRHRCHRDLLGASLDQDDDRTLQVKSNPTIQTTIRSDQELGLFNYYLDSFLKVLMLPNAHPGFYSVYRSEMALFMLNSDSVKCAILACCASNRFMLSSDAQFHKTSIKYYSQAVKEVNQALAGLDFDRDCPGNSLLTTVQYLYINALWGPDTVNDAPKHVMGAMQLLSLRYRNASDSLTMSSVFDRIVVESVLYQSFLLAMRNPFSPNFQIDSYFMERTEKLLETLTYWETSAAANSPVLGIPVPLYQLLLSVIQLGNSPPQTRVLSGTELKAEMGSWEQLVLDIEHSNQISTAAAGQEHPHWDAVALYVLAGSLLLDWILEMPRSPSTCIGTPPPPPPSKWQLSHALSILRKPTRKDSWTRCYLGSWPTMVLGYAVHSHEDIDLIKQVLCSTRQRLGYGEIERILGELEVAWGRRETDVCTSRRLETSNLLGL